MAKVSGLTKDCVRCNKTKKLEAFYMNRDYKDGLFRDNFCKTCFNDFVQDEETLREYFRLNNRVFPEALWTESYEIAKKEVENLEEYKNCRDLNKINLTIFNIARKKITQKMNLTNYYVFVDNTGKQQAIQQEEKRIKNSKKKNTKIEEEKIYSSEWHGYYTQSDIEYLDNMFNGLKRDFKIDNTSHIDYCRKTCKASLAMEKAYADMLEGKSGSDTRYKNLKDIYDTLSQSAKLAEKTRSETDNSGMGSLGEIIKRLETDGFLQKKITFEPDDVDKIEEDFRWTLASISDGEFNGDTKQF